MKQIYEPHGATICLLGAQSVSDAKYRPLTYIYECNVDEGLLIYNILTRELLLLNKDEIKLWNENIDVDNKITQELIKKWFFVPVENDDAKLRRQVRELLSAIVYTNVSAPTKVFTILPTTDCNARCFYCFELGRSRKFMSQKTAKDVADYIFKTSKGAESIKLRWFGGEPLYNIDAIDIICSELKKHNVSYTSEIISNGYLFNDENVSKAVSTWNTKSVQITLDGTEEIYNKCKSFIYHDGRSAFKVVTDNIGRLLNADILVKVRMNMDSHNESDLYNLTDYLLNRFGKYKKFFAYVHLLFEDSGKVQMERNDMERHMMIQKFFKFEDYLKDCQPNFPKRTVKSLIQYHQCMADDCATTTIMPDGELGKCEHYSDTDFWGSIYSDKIDRSVIEDFRRAKYLGEQCDKCRLYPLCYQLIRCAQTIPDRCDEVDKMLHYRNVERAIRETYRIYIQNNKIIGGSKDEIEIQNDC